MRLPRFAYLHLRLIFGRGDLWTYKENLPRRDVVHRYIEVLTFDKYHVQSDPIFMPGVMVHKKYLREALDSTVRVLYMFVANLIDIV